MCFVFGTLHRDVTNLAICLWFRAGLPTPQPDHAVIMVKFARECLRKMTSLTRGLEVELGVSIACRVSTAARKFCWILNTIQFFVCKRSLIRGTYA